MSLSSTEVELVALNVAVCHGICMKRLLRDFKKLEGPVTYCEDNQSIIRAVEDERDASRMKHIDVKSSFVREYSEKKLQCA